MLINIWRPSRSSIGRAIEHCRRRSSEAPGMCGKDILWRWPTGRPRSRRRRCRGQQDHHGYRSRIDAVSIADVHALRHDPDRMFEWLDRAWARHRLHQRPPAAVRPVRIVSQGPRLPAFSTAPTPSELDAAAGAWAGSPTLERRIRCAREIALAAEVFRCASNKPSGTGCCALRPRNTGPRGSWPDFSFHHFGRDHALDRDCGPGESGRRS